MTVTDKSVFYGYVVAEMFGPDGESKGRAEGRNLVTQVGDQLFAERGAGINTLAAVTGCRIGTGSTAAAKTGAGAAIVAKVTAGNKAPDSTAASALNGAARQITWIFTYAPGVGTSGTAIAEAVLVNDTIATDTATAAANTISRWVFAGLGTKGASDTLVITWTYNLQGT